MHASRRCSVIPDCVTGSQSDPLRNRSVLFLCFGKLLLGSEGFVALQDYLFVSGSGSNEFFCVFLLRCVVGQEGIASGELNGTLVQGE